MCSSKRPAGVSRRAGSSLIEVMVSIAILGLVVVPLCSSIVLAHRVNARAEALMQDQLAVSAAVERLMAQGVDVSASGWSQQGDTYSSTTEDGVGISAKLAKYDESGLDIQLKTCYDVTVSRGEVSIGTVVRAAASQSEGGGG